MAPYDWGTHLHAVDWSLIVVSGIFLGLRLYCKIWRHRGLWWDDHAVVAAWVSLLIEIIFTTVRIKMGFGKHQKDIYPQSNLPLISTLGKISSTFSIGAIVLSKTSFSLTLLRITDGYVRTFVWFVIVSMSVTMGLNLITVWLQCDDASCNSASLGYNIFSSAYSAFLDLALTLLPWKLLWGLSILHKERFGIILAMSMGVFAAFTAIMKCFKLPAVYRDIDDMTYHTSELVLWRTAEAATTIMAASIPILRVLIRDVTSPSNRFYASYNRRMAAHMGQGNMAAVEANPSFVRSCRSDMSMLDSPMPILGSGQILQTNEVTLEYHRSRYPEESNDSFNGYELDNIKLDEKALDEKALDEKGLDEKTADERAADAV